jgi:hypothetical protein
VSFIGRQDWTNLNVTREGVEQLAIGAILVHDADTLCNYTVLYDNDIW